MVLSLSALFFAKEEEAEAATEEQAEMREAGVGGFFFVAARKGCQTQHRPLVVVVGFFGFVS